MGSGFAILCGTVPLSWGFGHHSELLDQPETLGTPVLNETLYEDEFTETLSEKIAQVHKAK